MARSFMSPAHPPAMVAALVSGKGGVGKSTLCVGLGLGHALRGRNVLLIEFDVGLRGIDLMLGISDRVVYDLGDLLEGRCTISKALVRSPENERLSAIAAPMRLDFPVNLEDVELLISGLRPYFDVIILDTPAGLGLSAELAALADLTLIAVTPDPVCVRDGGQMVRALNSAGVSNHRLIINRVNEKLLRKEMIEDLDAVIDGVGSQLIGVVPDSPQIQISLARGVSLKEKHPVIRIFKAIAARTSGEQVPLLIT